MRLRSFAGVLVIAGFLVLPSVGVAPAEPSVPRGGVNWICLAYGGLAGAALMSGSLVGALGLSLGAYRAGCFG